MLNEPRRGSTVRPLAVIQVRIPCLVEKLATILIYNERAWLSTAVYFTYPVTLHVIMQCPVGKHAYPLLFTVDFMVYCTHTKLTCIIRMDILDFT